MRPATSVGGSMVPGSSFVSFFPFWVVTSTVLVLSEYMFPTFDRFVKYALEFVRSSLSEMFIRVPCSKIFKSTWSYVLFLGVAYNAPPCWTYLPGSCPFSSWNQYYKAYKILRIDYRLYYLRHICLGWKYTSTVARRTFWYSRKLCQLFTNSTTSFYNDTSDGVLAWQPIPEKAWDNSDISAFSIKNGITDMES